MTSDWKDQYAREQAIRDQETANYKAKRDWFNGLGPAKLAEHMIDMLGIPDADSNDDTLPERLKQQSITLDALFYTNLHEAGFGQRTKLDKDGVKLALDSQKQCRQTYDLLTRRPKTNTEIKKPKQTEG
jgi:hypothetical protein